MPPSMLISQLQQIGKMLNRWKAEIRLTVWVSAILFCLWAFAVVDVNIQYERTGRVVAWCILMILSGVALQRLARALSRVQTPEAVAVRVEQTFPELDNHLINFLQFSGAPGSDPFKAAYVKMDVPHWGGLDFLAMKDRRTHRRVQIALGIAILFMLIPLPFVGRAWPVAVWRIANPFSNVAPVSLTHILRVTPGTTSVLQGGNVVLACQVEGKRGHAVWLDVKPADSALRTYSLGSLKGADVETFSNTLYKVTTAARYRFRAGDAFSPDWYEISLRPPLAFTGIELEVTPPAYTTLPKKIYDAHAAAIDVPLGSVVKFKITCNAPLASLSVSGQGLARNGGAALWEGAMTVTNGATFVLVGTGGGGDKVESSLNYNLLPDRPPSIEIIAPKQAVSLMPGNAPNIDFSVSDDFGLDEITVQKLSDPADTNAAVEILKTYKWVTGRAREFTTLWKGAVRRPSEKGVLLLRLVAKDNCAGNPHTTVSPVITFNMDSVDQAAKKRSELEQQTLRDLNRIIELQREDIARTKQYQGVLASTPAEQWAAVGVTQAEIRVITKELLEKGGGKCLGNLLIPVKKLYADEMADVITVLNGIPAVKEDPVKAKEVAKALSLEEKIFRQLTFAELAVAQAKIDVRNSALIGMLDGLIANEARIIKATTLCITQKVAVAESLTTDQDTLGSDVAAFMKACSTEAESIKGDDKDFAAFLDSIAASCQEKNVRGDMLLAAERLEKNTPADALTFEQSARDKLMALRARFEEMMAKADKEKNEQMIEALQNANKKIEKLKELEKKLLEAMEAVRESKDKDTKKTDKMEEDFEEIKKNIEEAILQVPKDLDIFAELNVGNDMVEDIFSTFEEVTQQEGSEKAAGGPVKEMAVAKREYMLDGMEKVAKRLDDLESWLKSAPDGVKITTEAFDKEEMPNGVALAPLQTKMEDIIGDLLKEDKEKQDQDADGAINSATPDMLVSGPITEGDVTCFSAKGRSGNETPDHKEQDGRSNVGRQGMANGETAAGSGTIGKGDDNIEARRTQDPTQSGQVNVDGEDIKTKATGGGKLGTGKGDKYGMGGGKDRMDSQEAGSMEAMSALMAKQADQTYAQASMKGMRTDSIKQAAHHIRQLQDAIARGAPIDQVAELKRKAVADLKKAKTELGKDNAGELDGRVSAVTVNDIVEAGSEEAPPKYRDLVSEYYKKLSESL